MSARWLVERKRDGFEDVGANYIEVQDGCLVFYNDRIDDPSYLIAAGQWITVVEAAE